MTTEQALLIAFWVSFSVSAIAAYPTYRLLLKTKSRQIIDPYAPEKHMEKQGTPTMGGLIILAGAMAGLLALRPWMGGSSRVDSIEAPGIPYMPILGGALALMIGFAFIGFADDFIVPRMVAGKRGLGWRQKIVLEVLFAVVGVGLAFGWYIGPATALAVFTVLFFANAYNFSDGLDGLAGSLLLGLAAGLFVLNGIGDGYEALAPVFAVLVGGTLPFLFLNAPPAKVFMGDVGSLPIGAVLGLAVAVLAFGGSSGYGLHEGPLANHLVHQTLDAPNLVAIETTLWLPLLILSLPMIAELVPVPLQVGYYKLTKKRLFPMTPIHHAFEKMGWPESRVVWSFALFQLLCSALAVTILILMPGSWE
jgi:phospho-N-acetylmuramoyl-pentapeptide-transferase